MSATKTRWVALGIMIAMVASLVACSDDDAVTPVQPSATASYDVNAIPLDDAMKTPFQRSTQTQLAERRSSGLPAPTVSYTYESSTGKPLLPGRPPAIVPGEEVVITATTIMEFDGPAQAGLAEWPAVVIEGERPDGATGVMNPGDYTQHVRDLVEEEDPTVWTRHTFGLEPRTYTVRETFTLTYPELPPDEDALVAGTATRSDNVVMGFTLPGPDLNYNVYWDWTVFGIQVIEFSAGAVLDWGVGLRLPMQGLCTSTEPMTEGSTYYPTGKMSGLNYSAGQFAAAGVPAEAGNEFVMRFVFGFHVYLRAGPVTLVNLNWGVSLDKSRSFTTPFGPYQSFPIPSLNVPLYSFNLSAFSTGIGFVMTPNVGSEKFTASWSASGDASGSGSLYYNRPGSAVTFGAVRALDGPGTANLRISNYAYYFNRCIIDLGLSFNLNVAGIWGGTFVVPVYSFNLSAVLGRLWVRQHGGASSSMNPSFTIQNAAPSALIDRSGAVMASGMPTLLGRAGTPVRFTAHASDPGRDDLTVTWDFGDGGATPDASTHYPVPYSVTETQFRSLSAPRIYTTTLTVTDEDGAIDNDQVTVLVVGVPAMSGDLRMGRGPRPIGFWERQFQGTSVAEIAPRTLEQMLSVVSHMSQVFDDVRNAATIEAAYKVIFMKETGGSARDMLDRELLGVWLNFAIGLCPYSSWVDVDGDNMGDTRFADALHAVETTRMNPAATDAELMRQLKTLQRINAGHLSQTTGLRISS